MYNFFCIFFFRTILLTVRYKMMKRKTAYKRQIISYLISKITAALFKIKLEEFVKIPVTFRGEFFISSWKNDWRTWIPKVIEIFTFFVFICRVHFIFRFSSFLATKLPKSAVIFRQRQYSWFFRFSSFTKNENGMKRSFISKNYSSKLFITWFHENSGLEIQYS